MFAFAASSFLSEGTACHLERLICIVGTDPGLCSPEGTHRDPDQCLCQQCSLWRHRFLMALHDEPDHLCSAGAAVPNATSSRQSLGRWCSPRLTTCSSAVQVCDRELLHSGCLLYVLWLGILYLRCRLDVLHNWLRCLDHHQGFLNSCNSLS